MNSVLNRSDRSDSREASGKASRKVWGAVDQALSNQSAFSFSFKYGKNWPSIIEAFFWKHLIHVLLWWRSLTPLPFYCYLLFYFPSGHSR